jgi:hypothetical protein
MGNLSPRLTRTLLLRSAKGRLNRRNDLLLYLRLKKERYRLVKSNNTRCV